MIKYCPDIYSDIYPGPTKRAKQTVQVETSQVLLQESGVNLLLTVVDTPGFGDAIDNSNCWDPVLSYVESQVVISHSFNLTICRGN